MHDDSAASLTLAELTSAEEFLDYFGVAYDPDIVRVKRLHILQRFHDYLEQGGAADHAAQAAALARAYADFVHGNVREEQVFRVFQRRPGAPVRVRFDALECPPRAATAL